MQHSRLRSITSVKDEKRSSDDLSKRHIFIDFSNLVSALSDYRLLNVEAVIDALASGRILGKRYVIGSDKLQHFESIFKKRGFLVKIIKGKETLVDDAIVAAIMNEHLKILETHVISPTTHHTTFVILTGDGNDNHDFPNFKSTIRRLRILFYVVLLFH
jgi:NYN domain